MAWFALLYPPTMVSTPESLTGPSSSVLLMCLGSQTIQTLTRAQTCALPADDGFLRLLLVSPKIGHADDFSGRGRETGLDHRDSPVG